MTGIAVTTGMWLILIKLAAIVLALIVTVFLADFVASLLIRWMKGSE